MLAGVVWLVPQLCWLAAAPSSQPIGDEDMTELSLWLDSIFSSKGYAAEMGGRLVLACLAGGLIGLEREIRGREAGLRTFMLVAIGSALAMIVSIFLARLDYPAPSEGMEINADPGRIAYGVMTGIGFLGAGTIIQMRNRVHGLTTAAGIWCVAAIGLAAGAGMYLLTLVAVPLLLLVLVGLDVIEEMLPRMQDLYVRLSVPYHGDAIAQIRDYIREHDLTAARIHADRKGGSDRLIVGFRVRTFSQPKLDKLFNSLIDHPHYDLRRWGR